ncbi:MAG: Xaa-Pro aminopeptidase [Candidatus Rokuibacteriota bacterium]|nr:MAG: Xaa-Pro aminopeptidase [Candidatus Rokubacteria bacterium]
MTDQAPFIERRQRFAEAIGDAVAIVPAAGEVRRNSDVHYEFRQDSDFFFLTGFDEPDAVAVLNPTHAKERYVLFVRPRDREMEIWNGLRAGAEGAVRDYGADAAYPIDQLDEKLREYVVDRSAIVYRLGNPQFDGRIIRLVEFARAVRTRSRPAPVRIEDPGPIVHELRLRRSPAELARHRRACEISRDAHIEAMRYARPGLLEYEVQAALEFVFRVSGSPRNGYPSIVASGPNACILHYTENRRRMEDGDLLLIDAGCEYGYHSADITRTFPVNGRFTAPQRAIYEIVLRAQLAGIAAGQAGVRYEKIHETAKKELTAGLIDLGLLPRGLDESLAMHHYREFYMHGTGHWLGMDVHDVGSERESATFSLREYSEEEMYSRRQLLGAAAARRLEEEEKAKAEKIVHPIPREFRGIGIRIEDDVLVTTDGVEVLTAGTPKAIDEVERVCAEPPRLPRRS